MENNFSKRKTQLYYRTCTSAHKFNIFSNEFDRNVTQEANKCNTNYLPITTSNTNDPNEPEIFTSKKRGSSKHRHSWWNLVCPTSHSYLETQRKTFVVLTKSIGSLGGKRYALEQTRIIWQQFYFLHIVTLFAQWIRCVSWKAKSEFRKSGRLAVSLFTCNILVRLCWCNYECVNNVNENGGTFN